MKLSSLLTALGNNQDLTLTLLNSNDIKMIDFNASGYKLIAESDIGDKEVKRIKLISATEMYISVEDNDDTEEPTVDPEPVTPDEPEPEPEEPTDPTSSVEPIGGD